MPVRPRNLSKKSRRERREDKDGGTAPKSTESKGGQQKSSTQGSKMDVDLLCIIYKREGHVVKDGHDANDEQKKDLLKLKWKEWKAEKAIRTERGCSLCNRWTLWRTENA
jgi:hypothetical protein